MFNRKRCLMTSFVRLLVSRLLNSAAFCSSMGNIVMQRSMKPWLYPEVLFAATTLKRLQNKCLDVLHHMTNSVIRTRKLDLLKETRTKGAEQSEEHVFGNYFGFSAQCLEFRL
jgi:hypothetical protein